LILHVCTFDKFIPPVISLIEEEFSSETHEFWLTGTQKLKQYPIGKRKNVFSCKPGLVWQLYAHFKLLIMLHRSRKVIIHGLFSPAVVTILALCPWILKRCYWVIWGGDLYQYQKPKVRLQDRLTEHLRQFIIKRFGHLVTYLPHDIERAREWYSAQGEYHDCLMYLSNVVNSGVLKRPRKSQSSGSGLKVLVGNSADPSNNHIDALKLLLPYKQHNIKVFVPLSYGDKFHAQKVIEQGKAWFGHDNFFPIVSFMEFDQYLEFLGEMDVALFFHHRQQAMGNTISLLGLGKTVYMRCDVSQWQLFKSLNIRVFDASKFDGSLLDSEEASKNILRVREFFSRETLISQYSKVFS